MEKIRAIMAFNPYVNQIKPNNNNDFSQFADKKIGVIDQRNPGSVPFGALTGKSESPVSPPNAKQNYENGLAPLSNLKNVYAGEYNGKNNILNQIGIA